MSEEIKKKDLAGAGYYLRVDFDIDPNSPLFELPRISRQLLLLSILHHHRYFLYGVRRPRLQ